VGGFTVSQPPATTATVQTGINNLPHPNPGANACTDCHQQPSGGKNAIGYDHASALVNSACNACHEAGSNLLSPVWNPASQGTISAVCSRGNGPLTLGSGDTRAINMSSLPCSDKAQNHTCGGRNCVQNHFYSSDCSYCHVAPTGLVTTSTGSTFAQRWRFKHGSTTVQNITCCQCHDQASPGVCKN